MGASRAAERIVVWIPLLALLVLPAIGGAEVTARARLDATELPVGGRTTLSIEIQGAQDVPAPTFDTLDGLAVQYLGPSTQISIVNGRMTSSITHRYSVTAEKAGQFAIGPVSIPYQGSTIDAGTATLTAAAGGQPASGAQSGSGRASGNPQVPGGRNLTLQLQTPKTTVYLHERLPLNVRLRVGNVRISDLQYPRVPGDGFALEAFPEPRQYKDQQGGSRVDVVEFQTLLTPHRSGTLTIGPAKMAMNVVGQNRRADPFFGSFFGGRRQPIDLDSQPIVLEVLPLPSERRPTSFAGGVGTFTMQVAATPLEVTEGDPVTVTIKIRARGNLEQVTPPSFAASDDLRTYPVQQMSVVGADTSKVQERTFEQVVIPERAGALTLPALELGYFDPDAATYKTTRSSPIALRVTARAGDDPRPQVVGAAPGIRPAPEETLGRDIVFIKDDPGRLVPIGQRLYRRALFWLYLPLPLLAWLGVVAWDRRRARLHGDEGYARFTRAGRTARQALAEAEAALTAGDRAGFYDRVTRAVSEYLAAKLALPPGDVNADSVAARLDGQKGASAVADEVRELFAACEQVRFAPDAEAGDMQRTLTRATEIIRTVERTRKLSAPRLVAILLLLGVANGLAVADENPVALFFRANELYGAERFADAAATYEQVLDLGRESAALHFNTGNAHFKMDDVGRAVLGYERARRLAPRDPDLAANLAYARTLAEEADGPSPLRTLLVPLSDRMSSDELLALAALAYTMAMAALIVMRLAPPLARGVRLVAITAGIVAVMAGTSGAHRVATVDLPQWAVVVDGDDRAVRFEPSATGTEHFSVKPGRVLRILAERDTWAQVARRDGKRGWIERTTLAPL